MHAESISLGKEASIFQAEAFAIDKAAQKMNEILGAKDKYIRIFSDSQAVLKGLDKQFITSKTIHNARPWLTVTHRV